MTADPIHMPKDTLPTLLTLDETAKALKVSTKTVRRWIDAGDLVAHRLGHQWRISKSDLHTFIRMRREG